MSLSHRRDSSLDIPDEAHNAVNTEEIDSDRELQNVKAHIQAFCGRFRNSIEDIPLGSKGTLPSVPGLFWESDPHCGLMSDIEQLHDVELLSWMTVRFNMESVAQMNQIHLIPSKLLLDLLSVIEQQLVYSMELKLIHPPVVPLQSVWFPHFCTLSLYVAFGEWTEFIRFKTNQFWCR